MPTVVLNRDTERRREARAFLHKAGKKKYKELRIHRTWSVDTCQMWLSGWGSVIDDPSTRNIDRVVQLPGDIETVHEEDAEHGSFFNNLNTFVNLDAWDVVVGDFTSGDMYNAKELIDWYGTNALMANWFPDVANRIRLYSLNKPRSEFLNINVGTLKGLLKHRKFAYEQTLNMLIRLLDGSKMYNIKIERLGILKDDSSFRQYSDCLDQIERTERMLKLLWREYNGHLLQDKQQEFIDQYDRLDRLSTSIRENARVIIRNLLMAMSDRKSNLKKR